MVNKALIQDVQGQTVSTATSVVSTRLPHLTLSKQADIDTVEVGGAVTFNLIVSNPDTVPVPGPITLIDSLPPSVKPVSITGNPTADENLLTWTLDALEPAGKKRSATNLAMPG